MQPDGCVGERRAAPLGDVQSGLAVGVRQDRDELLAAVPRQHVAGPQRAAQPLGGLDQHHVPALVAVRVVDVLEVVEVRDQQGERHVGAHRPLALQPQHLLEEAAVVEPCEAVGDGKTLLLLQRGVELVGDPPGVGTGEHEADDEPDDHGGRDGQPGDPDAVLQRLGPHHEQRAHDAEQHRDHGEVGPERGDLAVALPVAQRAHRREAEEHGLHLPAQVEPVPADVVVEGDDVGVAGVGERGDGEGQRDDPHRRRDVPVPRERDRRDGDDDDDTDQGVGDARHGGPGQASGELRLDQEVPAGPAQTETDDGGVEQAPGPPASARPPEPDQHGRRDDDVRGEVERVGDRGERRVLVQARRRTPPRPGHRRARGGSRRPGGARAGAGDRSRAARRGRSGSRPGPRAPDRRRHRGSAGRRGRRWWRSWRRRRARASRRRGRPPSRAPGP